MDNDYYDEPWACCWCGRDVYAHTEVISDNMSFCSSACAQEYHAAQAEVFAYKEIEPEF